MVDAAISVKNPTAIATRMTSLLGMRAAQEASGAWSFGLLRQIQPSLGHLHHAVAVIFQRHTLCDLDAVGSHLSIFLGLAVGLFHLIVRTSARHAAAPPL